MVETLLQRIEKAQDGVESQNVACSLGVDHQVIVGAVKSLQSLGEVSFRGLNRSGSHAVTSTFAMRLMQ